jgi:glutamate-1-semialdehyde 2,1-aminomutase
MTTPSRSLLLAAALEAAVGRYRTRNPRSEAQWREATAVLPGGNTRSVLFFEPFPLTMVRGQGCRLWDADGHEYLDALGEFSAGLYGHSDPAIRAAIDEALDGGLSLSAHTAREAALATEIQRRFTSMQRLRFTNSGTEANLLAIAAALAHTGRRKVMVFDGAYHGGVLSFANGGSPVNVPHEFVVARYNDLDDARALARSHAGSLAAVLVEPLLGAGGCIPGDPAFLQGLRDLCDDCGAVLIFDEVMTSRLSAGGRQALLGIAPDLTTIGKYFGGGLSFGAFGGRAEIMDRFDPRRPGALPHAGTFNNNVLSMAAGLAGLRHVLTPQALDSLNRRGDTLRDGMNGVLARNGVDAQVTGIGSLLSLHMTSRAVSSPADLHGADADAKALVFFDLLERRVFLAKRGYMALSVPFDEAACAAMLRTFSDVIEARIQVLPARSDAVGG